VSAGKRHRVKPVLLVAVNDGGASLRRIFNDILCIVDGREPSISGAGRLEHRNTLTLS